MEPAGGPRARSPLIALAVAATLLLLLPAAHAQTTDASAAPAPTTAPYDLFLHFRNAFQEAVITPDAPPATWSLHDGGGLATHTAECLPIPGQGLVGRSWHTWRGIVHLAGNIRVEDGNLVLPLERGMDWPLAFDVSQPTMLHVYLETGVADTGPTNVPLVVPQVVVSAALREGTDISPSDAAYDEGVLLADGAAGPHDLSPQGGNHHMVDGRHVYAFDIPLEMVASRVNHTTGFNLRIDARMEVPGCDGFMPDIVALHSSPDFRPRLSTHLLDPIARVGTVSSSTPNGTAFGVAVTTPFGGGDVVARDVRILGVDNPNITWQGWNPEVHCHCYDVGERSARLVWLWDHVADGYTEPTATVEVDVTNLQGTANQTIRFTVPLVGAADRESPGAGLLAVVGLLAALAVVAARRWR